MGRPKPAIPPLNGWEDFALDGFYEITMMCRTRDKRRTPLWRPPHCRSRPTWEHRLQAVPALLGGEPVPHVTARFGMGRSILYKWRHRALQTALQGALTDHRPGPQCPASGCRPLRKPPWWSWPSAIRPGVRRGSTPRPAQRRPRPARFNACGFATRCPACPNGPPPVGPRGPHGQVKEEARRLIEVKPWLGPERLAWELRTVASCRSAQRRSSG